jgi:hypothetical protein
MGCTTVAHVTDRFTAAAGSTPPRGDAARWRQVALLALAASLGDRTARPALAAALQSLDHPVEAGRALAAAPDDDPWTRWWAVLAVGQGDGADGLDRAITAARVISTSPGSTASWSAMAPCRARRAIGTSCSRDRLV